MITNIVSFIEGLAVAKITDDEKDVLVYGDENISGEYNHWEPAE